MYYYLIKTTQSHYLIDINWNAGGGKNMIFEWNFKFLQINSSNIPQGDIDTNLKNVTTFEYFQFYWLGKTIYSSFKMLTNIRGMLSQYIGYFSQCIMLTFKPINEHICIYEIAKSVIIRE